MYNAFISYSHAADGKLAPALQTALEKFAKPWYKVRYLNVFRDEASLTASPHLWSNIQSALDESEYMIYMASPTSANSKWVVKEIEHWLATKSVDTILIALTEGDIFWDDSIGMFSNTTISLPEILKNNLIDEPFYVDFRNAKTQEDVSLNNPIFKKEVLKLAAHLHGKQPKDLASEEVSAHNRMIMVRNGVIGVLGLLLCFAIGAAWLANKNANEAKAQTKIATQQRDFSQANYLISEAQLQAEKDPTIALRLAQVALQKSRTSFIEETAYKIYHENVFYKLIGVKSKVTSEVAYSPDNHSILAGFEDKTARIIDLNGNILKEFKGHEGPVTAIAFSSKGNFVLSGSGGLVLLWDRDGNLLQKFPIKAAERITSVSFSADGQLILTSSWDQIVRLWNLKGKLISVIKDYKEYVYENYAVFSPDGKSILTCYNYKARLWNLEGKLLKEFIGHSSIITSIAFSPNGKYILTGANDLSAMLWKIDGTLLRVFQGHTEHGLHVAFSPDSKFILTGSRDRSVIMWDIQGNKIMNFIGHANDITSVSFSHDGKSVLTVSEDNTIRHWYLQGGLLHEFESEGYIVSLAISPDGASILSSSIDYSAILWGINGKPIHKFKGHSDFVNSVAFSPDGKTILTGSSDSTARIWGIDGTMLHILKGHSDIINSVAFSPDGKFILTGSSDKTALLWSTDGILIHSFTEHLASINSVAFSPDGQSILIGASDSSASLWNREGGIIRKFKVNSNAVSSVSFSPDGKQILLGGSKPLAGLWDINGNIIHEFKDDSDLNNSAESVTFSPNGKYILIDCYDGTIRLYNTSGCLLWKYYILSNRGEVATFSPDGKFIIGVSGYNIKIWDGNLIPLTDFLVSDKIEPLSSEQKKKYSIE